MWVVKWVEMDDIFNYYPGVRIFSDYESARNYQYHVKADLERLIDKMECNYEGKIISEILIDEIELNKF